MSKARRTLYNAITIERGKAQLPTIGSPNTADSIVGSGREHYTYSVWQLTTEIVQCTARALSWR